MDAPTPTSSEGTSSRGTNDMSFYLSSLALRAEYLGQVKGMLLMLKDSHKSDDAVELVLVDHLERMLDDACADPDEERMTKPLMLMSALFILLKG
jgi:hypothetical protein